MVNARAGNKSGLGGWRRAVGSKNEQKHRNTRLNGKCQIPWLSRDTRDCVTVCTHVCKFSGASGWRVGFR